MHLQKIAQYFDHQLNTEDEQEFLSQLKQDPAGQQSFERKEYQRKIKSEPSQIYKNGTFGRPN